MRKTKKKNGRIVFTYKNSLTEEIDKCRKELNEKVASDERKFLRWQFNRAKQALDTYENRITALTEFIELAEKKLEESPETDLVKTDSDGEGESE